jgi:hypothetical protein
MIVKVFKILLIEPWNPTNSINCVKNKLNHHDDKEAEKGNFLVMYLDKAILLLLI